MVHDFILNKTLEYKTHENITALPLAFSTNSGSVRGGILGPDLPNYSHQIQGDGLGNTYSVTRFRHGDPSSINDALTRPQQEGTYIYLGPLHKHFGHFMTESIARTWITSLNLPDIDGVFFLPQAKDQNEREKMDRNGIEGWQAEALNFLGIENPMVVTQATKFEKVIIPQPGTVLFSDFTHSSYLSFLESRSKLRNKGTTPAKTLKLFYSRAKFDTSFLGESIISDFLETQGYETVYPELKSLDEQIELALHAEVAVGVQGSAFHIYNLLGKQEVRICILQRQSRRVTTGFIKSLEPFANQALVVKDPVITHNKDSKSFYLPDIEALLLNLKEIDPSIRVFEFPWSKYFAAVREELSTISPNV